jgi:DNA invertase Pin-like site-specific DNA recombinase
MRVSTDEQDLQRQDFLIEEAKRSGYYIAGIYREKSSGARIDRPELQRMINDLQIGDVVIAEKIDRISRLPLIDAEMLVASIREKGAKISIPGVVDLSELVESSEGISRIVLEAIQQMLLKLALQMSRDDYLDRRERQKQGIELAKKSGLYKGRKPDESKNEIIIELRRAKKSIKETSVLTGCSISQVKRIWKIHNENLGAGNNR